MKLQRRTVPITGRTGRTGAGSARQLFALITALVAATAIVVFPATARTRKLASSGASPVSITTCSIDASYAPVNDFYGPVRQRVDGDIRLAFVNNTDVAAVSVLIVAAEGAYKQHILVHGTFAHGITIERSFKEDSGANGAQNAKCTVAEIDFADGESWHSTSG